MTHKTIVQVYFDLLLLSLWGVSVPSPPELKERHAMPLIAHFFRGKDWYLIITIISIHNYNPSFNIYQTISKYRTFTVLQFYKINNTRRKQPIGKSSLSPSRAHLINLFLFPSHKTRHHKTPNQEEPIPKKPHPEKYQSHIQNLSANTETGVKEIMRPPPVRDPHTQPALRPPVPSKPQTPPPPHVPLDCDH